MNRKLYSTAIFRLLQRVHSCSVFPNYCWWIIIWTFPASRQYQWAMNVVGNIRPKIVVTVLFCGIFCSIAFMYYTVCKKTDTFLACFNFDINELIWLIWTISLKFVCCFAKRQNVENPFILLSSHSRTTLCSTAVYSQQNLAECTILILGRKYSIQSCLTNMLNVWDCHGVSVRLSFTV